MRAMLKSKIHRARVTETNLNYEGSITIDRKLMAAADILPYERVKVLNLNNGARFDTYAIAGSKGEICLNGAATLSPQPKEKTDAHYHKPDKGNETKGRENFHALRLRLLHRPDN